MECTKKTVVLTYCQLLHISTGFIISQCIHKNFHLKTLFIRIEKNQYHVKLTALFLRVRIFINLENQNLTRSRILLECYIRSIFTFT